MVGHPQFPTGVGMSQRLTEKYLAFDIISNQYYYPGVAAGSIPGTGTPPPINRQQALLPVFFFTPKKFEFLLRGVSETRLYW